MWVVGVSPGPHKINEGYPHELLNSIYTYMCMYTYACNAHLTPKPQNKKTHILFYGAMVLKK